MEPKSKRLTRSSNKTQYLPRSLAQNLNMDSTSTVRNINNSSSTSNRKRQAKIRQPLPEYDADKLKNWKEIMQRMLDNINNDYDDGYEFSEQYEEPVGPKHEDDFKVFHPTIEDLKHFEQYYHKVLLKWDKYYGGVVLEMPEK